jgi:polyferredoxin
MKAKKAFDIKELKVPLFLLILFWIIALVLWQATGKRFYLFNFGYIGIALGLGLGIYTALPRRKKLWGRRLAQILVGAYMLVFLGFFQHENMQIEGFFFYLLAGIFAGSVIHYLIAKVAGPLVFNRGWCGWACWTAMVLDLLPFHHNKAGRLPARWGWLRYLHFAISLALVLTLWFAFDYPLQEQGVRELYWLALGNLLYYAVGITLAFALRDNRAFCKYVCPIPTLQKLPARYALLKVASDSGKCTQCGACTRACPMDIRVADYAAQGLRVFSTECILCMECISTCPADALSASFALDGTTLELLRYRDRGT